MDIIYFPLILALLISIAYFFGSRHTIKNKEYGRKIFSFSAGVSITYVLLELFPAFTEIALPISKFLFISILAGFIIHHIIEKEIYKHNNKHELIRLLSIEENIFSFIYHIIIGIVLVTFSREGFFQAILFFVPMLSYTFLNNLPINKHNSINKTFFLSSGTLIGTSISLIFHKMIPLVFELILMGIAIGVLLFAIVRHHIPFGRRGKTGYFIFGFIVYSLLITLSWQFI